MISESSVFVLHRRNYGETSRIVQCLSRHYGRVDLVCKGCRTVGKRSRVLEPFRHYHVSWSGKSNLKTLRHVDEVTHFPISESAEKLYCGFYINELLSQILKHDEVDSGLFDLYAQTLEHLVASELASVSGLMRSFELSLLQLIGYGITLDVESDGVTPIETDQTYGFEPDHGFFRTTSRKAAIAQGDSIIALRNARYENTRQVQEAKNLMRTILGYYLPNPSIQSRKLFA